MNFAQKRVSRRLSRSNDPRAFLPGALTLYPLRFLMHGLLAYLLYGKRRDADLLVVEERLYPVRSRRLEGSVKADGNVPVSLGLVEEIDLCLWLREDLFLVRRQEPDLYPKFPLDA